MPARLDMPASGLRASRMRQAASAQNVANTQTDGYARQRISTSETASGGVRAQADIVSLSPEARQAAAELDGAQNDVDTAGEMVTQVEARSAFAANARVLRTTDRMAGSLLDLLA